MSLTLRWPGAQPRSKPSNRITRGGYIWPRQWRKIRVKKWGRCAATAIVFSSRRKRSSRCRPAGSKRKRDDDAENFDRRDRKHLSGRRRLRLRGGGATDAAPAAGRSPRG